MLASRRETRLRTIKYPEDFVLFLTAQNKTKMSDRDGSVTANNAAANETDDELIEDDKKARELMKEVGFNTDNVHQTFGFCYHAQTPLIRFCLEGNLKMCRYLLSRGADCREENDDGFYFPLYAAVDGGHVPVCEWLVHHHVGAHDDIRKSNANGNSPLRLAMNNSRNWLNVTKWLILHGALCRENDGNNDVIDDEMMRNDLRPAPADSWQILPPYPGWRLEPPEKIWKRDQDRRIEVLAWARTILRTHDNFKLFLLGTMVSISNCRSYRHQNTFDEKQWSNKREKLSTSSPLVVFNGTPNILRLVGDYVEEKPNAKELRTFHQLVPLLSAFVHDTPCQTWKPTDYGMDYKAWKESRSSFSS